MRKGLTVSIGLYAAMTISALATTQDARDYYWSHYYLAAYMSRAIVVCGGDTARTARAAVKAIHEPEIAQFGRAFPSTVKKWGLKAAQDLNQLVFSQGIVKACAYAEGLRSQLEQMQ